MGKMDAEEAVAYVYEAKPWRRMDEAERLGWCKRVREVLATGWTQQEFAPLLGLKERGLEDRLAWSKGRRVSGSTIQESRAKNLRYGLKDPEVAAQVFADPKVREAALNIIAKAEGQTRTNAPRSNVEDIFGPFVRLRNALGSLRRTLPDYTPGADIADEAQDTIADLEGTAEIIRAWLKGSDVADEVEAFLKGGTE